MSSESKTQDWSKPAAMAIPKGGYFQDKVEQGRYGPIFPRTPACYGFSILAKIIPGREDVFYKYAKSIEETIAAQPDALAVGLVALGAMLLVEGGAVSGIGRPVGQRQRRHPSPDERLADRRAAADEADIGEHGLHLPAARR